MALVDGVIRAVRLDDGAEVELVLEAGRVVDRPLRSAGLLPGRFVLAGLVDAHAHFALDFGGAWRPPGSPEVIADSLRGALRSGVLLARDVGAPVGVRVGGDHESGPHVLAAGRFLAPPNGYLDELFEGIDADDLESVALDELAASGSGWVKLVFDFPEHFTGPASFGEATTNYAAETVRGLCARVHGLGGRVAAHVSGPGGAETAVALGVDSLEHGPDIPLESLVELGARSGAWTPTLLTVWRDGLAQSPLADWQRQHYRTALAAALDVGVTVLAGTDAAGASTLADEIALLAELGLTPSQALAGGSWRAREYLGRPATNSGLVDLVTYHGDPRDDLAVLRQPAAIIRRGQRVA